MLAPETNQNAARKRLSSQRREQFMNSSRELKFITELGRSLLFTVHPKKVAFARSGSRSEKSLAAEICAVVVELEQIGLVSSRFYFERSADARVFCTKTKFAKIGWKFLPSQISFSERKRKGFFAQRRKSSRYRIRFAAAH